METTPPPPKRPQRSEADIKAARMKAALKANLQRRKVQARGRAEDAANGEAQGAMQAQGGAAPTEQAAGATGGTEQEK